MTHANYADKTLNRTERFHHYYMMDALRRFEWDMHHAIAINRRVPYDWHEISTKRDRATTRVTIRLDADVVKWFRSMGPRYQPRMNDVLRAFMHAKLMGLLQGDETLDQFREGSSHARARPEWGKTEREMGELLAESDPGAAEG